MRALGIGALVLVGMEPAVLRLSEALRVIRTVDRPATWFLSLQW